MPEDIDLAVGDWLEDDAASRAAWVSALKLEIAEKDPSLHPVVKEFKRLIEKDVEVYVLVKSMIAQVPRKQTHDFLGEKQVDNYDDLLLLINAVLTKAPEFTGHYYILLPIQVALDWALASPVGFAASLNTKLNSMIEKILNAWCDFLNTEDSLYVLNDGKTGWMCEAAKQLIQIDNFQHAPNQPHWGFKSWNDFFTRKFKPGVRPVEEPDNNDSVNSACESTPYRICRNAQKYSNFWLKSQPYSLEFMFGGDDCVDQFVGGTVYQAYLSAHNYHRWHSPVNGVIHKAWVLKGSYYSLAPAEGVRLDELHVSQPYLTHVATRAIMLIECDNPTIGLMAFIAVGIAEVSSCVSTVQAGQRVRKGDELGYFQFGGSTHCLIFRPGAIADFAAQAVPQEQGGNLVHVNSVIARANT